LPDFIPYFFHWSKSDKENLPEPYRRKIIKKEKTWKVKLSKIVKALAKTGTDQEITEDDLTSAWIALNTRTVYLSHKSDDSNVTNVSNHRDDTSNWALVPFLDCLNHHSKAKMKTNHSETHFQITSSAEIESGQQVYISYGQHSDTFLLIEYGFVIGQENDHNFVEIETDAIITSKVIPVNERQTILTQAAHFGCDSGFGIMNDGSLTWSLIRICGLASGVTEHAIYDSLSDWPMKSKTSTTELLIEILARKKKEFERSREKIEEQTVRSFLTNQIDLIDRSLKLTDLWE